MGGMEAADPLPIAVDLLALDEIADPRQGVDAFAADAEGGVAAVSASSSSKPGFSEVETWPPLRVEQPQPASWESSTATWRPPRASSMAAVRPV